MPITEPQYLDLMLLISSLKEDMNELKGLVKQRVILDKKKTLTIKEAADKLGKTYETIRRYIKAGKLEVKENSSPVRITASSLNNLLN